MKLPGILRIYIVGLVEILDSEKIIINLNKIMKATLIEALTLFLLTSSFICKSQDRSYQTPQELISSAYKLMSFEGGTTPDWDEIKDLFHPDAIIVLRTSMTEMNTMDRDGFIDLWLKDFEGQNLKETGIKEEKLIDRYEILGNIAICYVIYSVTILKSNYPPHYGVDCFHLLNLNGRWYITSIVNEAIRPGVGPPQNMKEDFDNYIRNQRE